MSDKTKIPETCPGCGDQMADGLPRSAMYACKSVSYGNGDVRYSEVCQLRQQLAAAELRAEAAERIVFRAHKIRAMRNESDDGMCHCSVCESGRQPNRK